MPSEAHHEFMSPIIEEWLARLEEAGKAKLAFSEIAEQADAFFSAASGFMWKPKFKSKFLGASMRAPKFQVTIAKAFELVAIFGPHLFWQYPNRAVRNHDPIQLPQELFADPAALAKVMGMEEFTGQITPELQQQIQQQVETSIARDQVVSKVRNTLMQTYLNYSQREQPGGGLAMHGELAITEALVKGRGLLWPEVYHFPGSGRTLTGLFFGSVDDFFIDPDSKDPTLSDAKWIARRHRTPTWELERRWRLPKGALENKAHQETSESMAVRRGNLSRNARRNGQTFDLVTWFEIWSKGGIGTRLPGVKTPLNKAFDDVVGDYAYICVTEDVPYPLNAPSFAIREADDEEVGEMFQWPVPYYTDDAWPVAILDFYPKYQSAWPIAPLAPAMGELICLNILTAAFVEGAFENRKGVVAYMGSAAQEVEQALRGNDNPAFIRINDTVHKKITDMIQYLNRPEMNTDLLKAIDYCASLFDKRTGLTEIMYAMNVGGTQSRTASDVASKEQRASIRPDKMSKDVARFMTVGANLEKFAAHWNVRGKDIAPLLGQAGAMFWDNLIANEDPELVVREMKATVEASDIRKPNKQRETANLQAMLGYTLPELSKHADVTGDTGPVNRFFDSVGKSMEQDTSGWHLGPRQPPPPPPEAQQAQQAQAQLEMANLQADLELKGLDADIKKSEVTGKQLEAMSSGEGLKEKQLELQFTEVEHSQELRQDEEKHDQEIRQDRESHLLDIIQRREEARQKIDQMQREGQVKVQVARATVRAKPSAQGNKS